MNKPAARPRPSGGFNQGIGHFNENLDENAMQAAVQQKTLGQQGTTGTPAPVSPTGTPTGALPSQPAPAEPRPIGSIKDELVTRPVQDVGRELAAFFDINALLGINVEHDDPQTQAQKKALHSRWQNLNQKQQQLAQKMFQEEMQKKKQEQEAEAQKKQQAERARADTLVVPTSTQKGPVGPGGSGKKAAAAKLQHDRQTLGGPKSAN